MDLEWCAKQSAFVGGHALGSIYPPYRAILISSSVVAEFSCSIPYILRLTRFNLERKKNVKDDLFNTGDVARKHAL